MDMHAFSARIPTHADARRTPPRGKENPGGPELRSDRNVLAKPQDYEDLAGHDAYASREAVPRGRCNSHKTWTTMSAEFMLCRAIGTMSPCCCRTMRHVVAKS